MLWSIQIQQQWNQEVIWYQLGINIIHIGRSVDLSKYSGQNIEDIVEVLDSSLI